MRFISRGALVLCLAVLGGGWAGAPALAQDSTAPGTTVPDQTAQDGGDLTPPATAPEEQSAGAVPSYTPTGPLVADDQFRPQTNGFGFENYGDAPANNLTPASVQDLFGAQVCASGSGATCQLIPPAQAWMDEWNKSMNGGHCYGFSVAALRFFTTQLRPIDFGGPAVPALALNNNIPLQQRIAESFTFQGLDSVNAGQFKPADPNDMLTKLQQVLVPGSSETWTLGFFKRDGSGGHAVTPYAVENNGGGLYHVLIYDNNYPNITRAVLFDTNKHTWSYDAQTNPSEPSELYEGDATTQSMDLSPTTPGLGQQPCPFCPPTAAGTEPGGSTGGGGGSTGPAKTAPRETNEITLESDPANSAHLIFSDKAGDQTGIINGVLTNNIPGARVIVPMSDRNWLDREEPKYHLPAGQDIRAVIDGSALRSPTTESLVFTGGGHEVRIDGINIDPGDREAVSIAADGSWIVYRTVRAESPELTLGFVGTGANEVFTAKAKSVSAGSTLRMAINKVHKRVRIDTQGVKGLGIYTLGIQRETKAGTLKFSHGNIRLRQGDVAAVKYGNIRRAGQKVKVNITHG